MLFLILLQSSWAWNKQKKDRNVIYFQKVIIYIVPHSDAIHLRKEQIKQIEKCNKLLS